MYSFLAIVPAESEYINSVEISIGNLRFDYIDI